MRAASLLLISALILAAAVTAADDVSDIEWRDLIPREMTREMAREGTIREKSIKFGQRYDRSSFPLAKALDGETVRILGFALPLEFTYAHLGRRLGVLYYHVLGGLKQGRITTGACGLYSR